MKMGTLLMLAPLLLDGVAAEVQERLLNLLLLVLAD